MTNNQSIYGLLILLFLVGQSCQEIVDLGPSELPPRLVVDGQITNEWRRHELHLTVSGDYDQNGDYKPATDAVVYLSDGQQTIYYAETEPGRYLTDSLQGVPGRSYTLTIQWQGTTYTATDSMGAVPEAFEPVSFTSELGFRQFEYRRHQFGFAHPNQWQLIVHRADTSTAPPVEEPYYGQQVGQVILPPGDTRFTFFTHTNIEVSGLMNFEDAHFYGFRPGRWVTQKRFSLSVAYYDYLRGVFLETEWRESLFAGTPANPRGNVSQGALGFFSASAVRTERFRLE